MKMHKKTRLPSGLHSRETKPSLAHAKQLQPVAAHVARINPHRPDSKQQTATPSLPERAPSSNALQAKSSAIPHAPRNALLKQKPPIFSGQHLQSTPKISQTAVAARPAQTHRTPSAPAVYRPQPAPAVLQAKSSAVQPVEHGAPLRKPITPLSMRRQKRRRSCRQRPEQFKQGVHPPCHPQSPRPGQPRRRRCKQRAPCPSDPPRPRRARQLARTCCAPDHAGCPKYARASGHSEARP